MALNNNLAKKRVLPWAKINATTGRLEVDVLSGGGGGTLKTDGEAIIGADTASIIAGTDGTDAQFIKTDSDGNLQVDVLSGGGGGTLKTDGEVIAGGDTSSIISGTDGTNSQFIKTDADGNLQVDVLSGGGGGTQYATDAVAPDPATGTAGLMERDDALSALTPVEGDWVRQRGTAEGALWTQDFNSDASLALLGTIDADTGVIAGDTTSIDGKITKCDTDTVTISASLPAGTNNIGDVDIASSVALDVSAATVPVSAATLPLPTGASTSALQLPDGHNVTVDNGAAGAAVNIQDGGNSITIDGTVTATATNLDIRDLTSVSDSVEVLQDTAADLNMTEVNSTAILADTASIDTNTGTIAGDTTSIDGKITACNTGAVTVSAALPAGTNAIGKLAANSGVDIGDVDVLTLPGVAGDVAADAADSGNPVKIGGKAKNMDATAPGTAVAEDDRTNFISDVYGRQFVETAHPNLWDVSADYAAAQTNTSVKAAPGAGLSLYVTDVMISNGAVAGNITLLDGSGGTVLLEIYPAINGGCVTNLKTPIKLTANTALVITSTTVTTHAVTINGYIAP
jgi:hypothetical protein